MVDRSARGAAEGARLVAFRVDVARDDRRRNGVVRIEQLERDDRAGVEREAVIVDRRRLHAEVLADGRVKPSELRIDAERVRDLAELVPVLIDERPLRIRIGLKEMSDDGEPLRRIEQHQFGAGVLDLASDGLVALLQRRPSGIAIRRKQNVRLPRNEIGLVNRSAHD